MVENEFELSAKAALPDLLGGTGIAARYKRTWTDRGTALTEIAARQADMSTEELGARLRDDEPLRDLYWRALNRVTEVGDPAYVDALGRLIAAACDDARIDEVGLVLAAVLRLEPAYLRALFIPWIFYHRSGETSELVAFGGPSDAHVAEPEPIVDLSVFAQRLGVGEATGGAVLDHLSFNGYFELNLPMVGASGMNLWMPSPWTHLILKALFPRLDVHPVARHSS